VATWARVEAEAPEVAAFAHRLWPGAVALDRGDSFPTSATWFAVAYLATVRRDGSPRLHPFCPIIAGGRLFAAIPRCGPEGGPLRRAEKGPLTCCVGGGGGFEPATFGLWADRSPARRRGRWYRAGPARPLLSQVSGPPGWCVLPSRVRQCERW